jgi:acyl carrier protein
LALGVGQVLAAQVDWPRYAKTALSAGALGMRIEGVDPTGDDLDVAPSPILAGNLRTCEAEALAGATGAYLGALVREISLLGEGDELPSAACLAEIGFDSLMLLTLKARLEADLGIGVPLSLLGGQTSIEGVIDHLVDDLRLSRIATARPEAEELAVL